MKTAVSEEFVRKSTRSVVSRQSARGGAKATPERTGVQSLARAFGILEEVARNREGIGLAELSKRIGLHNSTAFHLVKTLNNLGYLRQIASTKRYRLGSPLYAAAAGAREEIALAKLAGPVLEDLSSETEECCDFAVLCGNDAVILARTVGTGIFRPADRVGIIRPAHATALGKVLLASLDPDRLDRYFQSANLQRFTAKTIVEPGALRNEFEEIRRTGIAYDDGQFSAELRCVAVHVCGANAETVGAIGLSGPVWQLSPEKIQQKSAPLSAAAERLSNSFAGALSGKAKRPKIA